MIPQERTVEPAKAPSPASSPYLSLRQAVRPAIFAHFLLAEDQERAGQLAAECEDLLFLTRELLKAVGLADILGADPARCRPRSGPLDEDGGDRQAQLLGAYAEAGMLWAKVVGSTMALAQALLGRGDRDGARQLAGFLADAGEDGPAAELNIQLGKAVWDSAAGRSRTSATPCRPRPSARPSTRCGRCCSRSRRTTPTGTGRSTASCRRWPRPCTGGHAGAQEIDIPYSSRVEHIAAGGVARYPDIVKLSLDEIAAEFDGLCHRPANQ